MNDYIWQAEDGKLLKDLRTSSGMDIHEFARAASISAAQLRQLEDGGNELFYSHSIKFQLGRKLLKKLGADVVRADQEPSPETPSLFDFSPSPVKPPSLEETLSAAPEPVLVQAPPTAVAWNKSWIFVGVGVLALAGVFGAQLRSPSTPQPMVQASSPAPISAAPVVAAPTPAPPVEPPSPAPAVPAAEPAPALAPTTVATVASNTGDCQWDSGPGNTYMPRGMDRPTTYVHFVATVDATICVQDRNQKVTQVNLATGEKLTVSGAAPWRIQTAQWAGVSVFFQGYRMPIPASASLVTLNPRTVPLPEPAPAPTPTPAETSN